MSPQNYDFGDILEDIRSRLVWRLSILLTGFGIVATWYVLVRRDLPFAAAGIPLCFVVFSRIVQIILNKNPALSRYIFVWGMAAHLTAVLLVFNDPLLPYVAVPTIFISAMLIRNGGLLSTMFFVAAAALLNLAGIRSYPLFELTVVLTLAASASWVSAYTLYSVVHWYSTARLHSQQLLETTRNHRAELTQALKSLQLAYETQKHIQLELVWARKHAEDAQRLKEQFAANISHELWTPLNLILGFSEVMYLSPEVYGDMTWAPGLRRDIYQIYRNSQHLLGLIGDILDLSRFEMTGFNIAPEPTSLVPFLKDTLEIVANSIQGRALRCELSIQDDLPIIEIDCTRIRQVILNLLNNACRFAEAGVIELAAQWTEQEVVISVRDTGPGIPADKLPHLFDEFYQANPSLTRTRGGAGLGLAISKRFVEAHGGRIWAESEEGVGTCLSFSLPVIERLHEVQHPHSGDPPTSPSASHQCVLVLGADSGIIPPLERCLKHCEVIQVSDSRDLLDMILIYHPKMIIYNRRPGQPPSASQTLVDTGVPIIECMLPTNADTPQEFSVHAYLTQPINSQTLFDEIDRIGGAHNVLIAFADRSFALLIERMLEAGDTGFEIHRVYDYEDGRVALQVHCPDLVMLDTIAPQTDGRRFLEYMRTHPDFESLPVMVLTKNVLSKATSGQNRFIIYQREGLYPSEILKFLGSVYTDLSPRYYRAVAANHG